MTTIRQTISAMLLTLLSTLFPPLLAAAPTESPQTIAGATTVDVTTANQLFRQGALFIDVRKPKGYDMGRVPGAINLPLNGSFDQATLQAIAEPDDELVIYCGGTKCPLSARAVNKAVSWGYHHIYYFRSGLPGWEKAGYPVE